MPHSFAAALDDRLVAGLTHAFWLYGLSSISFGVGAFLCYRQIRGRSARSFRDFLAFVFPKQIIFHRSVRLDLCFVVVRRLTLPWVIVPFSFSSAVLASWIADKFTLVFGIPVLDAKPSFLTAAGLTLAIIVATDFGIFISHYLQHRIPVLWEFHKVHHAAPVLVPPTVLRVHPVDEIGRGLGISLCSALVGSVFLYFYPTGLPELTLAGIDAYFIAELLIFRHLRHSHMPLRFGSILESVLLSPALHHLHHSSDPRHYDKNFGLMFAVWDRVMGTFVLPTGDTHYEFGLNNGEHLAYDSVWAFYTLPIARLTARYAPAWSRLRPARRSR